MVITRAGFGKRKPSLQKCCQEIIFFAYLGDLKSEEKAVGFFLSDQFAICLILLSPPPNKMVLLQCCFLFFRQSFCHANESCYRINLGSQRVNKRCKTFLFLVIKLE